MFINNSCQLRHNVFERSEEKVIAEHDVELVNVVHKLYPEVEEPDAHDELVPDWLVLIHCIPESAGWKY